MSVTESPPPPWPLRLAVVVFLALLMVVIWQLLAHMGMPESFSASVIADWLQGHGRLSLLLLLALMLMAVVVGPIPTMPITAAAGMAFGVVFGSLVAAIGALAGALLAFFAARLLGRDLARQRLPDNPLFQAHASQKALAWMVLLTRLIPLFSFALISYLAGLTAIRPWRFALATFIGMLPMTVVFATLGHGFQFHPALTASAAVFILMMMLWLPYYLNRHHPQLIRRWLKDGEGESG